MVTAESKPENVVAAKAAGVNNYIVKPFNAETLSKKIEAVLGAAEMKARRRLTKAEYANMEAFVEAHPHGPCLPAPARLLQPLLVAEELRAAVARDRPSGGCGALVASMRQELVGITAFHRADAARDRRAVAGR